MKRSLIFILLCMYFTVGAQQIFIATDTLFLEVGYGKDTEMLGQKNGKWMYFYENDTSKVKYCAHFSNNKLNGLLVAYWYNGRIKAKINFINDIKEGEALYYSINGELLFKMNYFKDLLDGNCYEYYKSGRVRKLISYKEGLMDGISRTFNDDKKNSIRAEGEFKNGIANGKYISYSTKWNKSTKIIEQFENGKPIHNRQVYVNNELEAEDVLDSTKSKFVKTIQYKENRIVKEDYSIGESSNLSTYFIYGRSLYLHPNFK